MSHRATIPGPLRLEIQREAVLQGLAEFRDYPLVALLAPSGYGKTTALAQYARTVSQTVAWLLLDEESTDVQHVCAAILGTLCQASPELGALFEAEYPDTPGLCDARLLAGCLNASSEHVLLVLDRVEMLSEDGGRWLARLVEGLREGHQVMISGYPALAMPLARLVARGQAVILDQHSLAFSTAETQQLTGCSEDDTGQLVEVFSGWPIALALHRSERRSGLSAFHLIDEVMAELPAPIRDLLPDLAPCQVWSEAFAQACGSALPVGWLEAVQRCGLPVTPLGDDTFLPHRQLLRWLRRQLEAQPERAQQRHSQVAAAYEASGQPLHAIRTLLDSGHSDQAQAAEALALKWMAKPWARAEFQSVLSVLLEFPVLHRPELRSVCAYALTEVGRCEEAAAMFGTLDDATGFHREYGLALLAGRRGQYDRAVAHLDTARHFGHSAAEAEHLDRLQVTALISVDRRSEAAQLFDQLPRQPGTELWDAVGQHLTRLRLLPLGEYQEYIQQSDQLGCQLIQGGAPAVLCASALPELLTAQLLGGQPLSACALLEHPELLEPPEWGTASMGILRARGDAALAAGEFGVARDFFERSLQIAQNLQYDLGSSQAVGRLADLACLEGDLDQARLHAAGVSSSGHPADRALELYLSGVQALIQGDQGRAGQDLQAAAEVDVFSVYRWRALGLLESLSPEASVSCPPPPPLEWLDQLTRQQLGVCGQTLPGGAHPPATWATGGRADAPVLMNVRTFRRFEVTIGGGGVGVHFPFTKAAELCAYLLVHGQCTRNQIVDALWNGSADPRHMDYFRVAVRRLRLALADAGPGVGNPIVFQDGHYGLSDRYQMSLDFQLISELHQTLSCEKLDLAWKAYEGDFLPTLESEWAEVRRTDLREQLIQASLTYAHRQADTAHDSAAAYREVLRLDRLNEAGHLGLIQFHLGQGEQEVAAHLYQRYAQLIRDEFGVAPSPALQRLFSGSP